MENIIELSSDSEDTIIFDPFPESSQKTDNFDDLENALPLMKRLRRQQDASDDLKTLNDLLNKYKENDDDKTEAESPPIRDKDKLRLAKEQQIEERLKMRQEKKEAAEREKAIRQALATSNKNLKPEECLKFIVVQLDDDFKNEKYYNCVKTVLNTAGISLKFIKQGFSQVITWNRIVQSHLMNDEGQLTVSSTATDTNELILIIKGKDLIEFVTKETLHDHLRALQAAYINKKIFLVVFAFRKSLKNQPKSMRNTVETVLNELQLFYACSHRFIETEDDLAQLIFQFTKSIAQLPFKEKKHEQQAKADWFMAGDNRNCVKIDTNGNGLQRLWHQLLTTFPLTSLETAEAISLKYPTLSSLMQAYDQCNGAKEGRELLQDIPIRRAAGPLVSVRKIGPELSRKIYNFYTSTDGESLL